MRLALLALYGVCKPLGSFGLAFGGFFTAGAQWAHRRIEKIDREKRRRRL
jgi:hypothetical protein